MSIRTVNLKVIQDVEALYGTVNVDSAREDGSCGGVDSLSCLWKGS